ncbi:MAG: 2-amino-thiazoline-4-carboxylic acid hydrolase [Hyphomicrobiales bacterium]|nr:MAG: 2-amino-thiazoline-4-carboxylic acid hydrolase [Hyphomicrobiales bacterium]
MSDAQTLGMLERRRIEAQILKHVYDELKASQGVEVAQRTIANAVRQSAIEQGKQMAAEVGGKTSLASFQAKQDLWTRGDALKIDVIESSDDRYRFNVTMCRYAQMYKEMGLGEIGHLLSCQRDGTFCEGYDPNLKFKRTQTIMQGASHCDFEYTYQTPEQG